MKAKKLRTIVVAVFAAGIVSPIFAQAESLESLQEQMKAAINEQRFEDAAVIRDKIKEIQEGKNE